MLPVAICVGFGGPRMNIMSLYLRFQQFSDIHLSGHLTENLRTGSPHSDTKRTETGRKSDRLA